MTTSDPHAHFVESLPALLGGRLPPDDAARVVAHAEACFDCGAELELGRRVRAHFAREWNGVESLFDAGREQAGFDRLLSRIAAAEPAPVKPLSRRRNWAAAVSALAATLLIGVGFGWYRTASAPEFRTLAEPPARSACGNLRVQIDADVATADAVRLLEAAGVRVVDGPSPAGVYTLTASDPAESLRHLRAQSGVRLAEPTGC